MKSYFEPTLSEEQMAAYLDGMLTTEESNYVEDIIDNDSELQEIQNTIDEVDSSYIISERYEPIPDECLSDDFVLPEIGFPDYDNTEAYPDDSFTEGTEYNEEYCQDMDTETDIEDSSYDETFDYNNFIS